MWAAVRRVTSLEFRLAATTATRLIALIVGLSILLGGIGSANAGAASGPEDGRLFLESGYRISNDAFWDYFQRRGSVATFGFPISRQFTLHGFAVQLFQHALLQQRPDGTVAAMNLLDRGLMPYTQFNYSIFPASNPELAARAPVAGSLDFGASLGSFVRETVPETFAAEPVGFYSAYLGITHADQGTPLGADEETRLFQGLETWGLPTSNPAADPNDPGVIYQRFQRGVMQYASTCRCTRAATVADYFKALLTGEGLPQDLDAEAADSPFLRQYDPTRPHSLARPAELPSTDLTDAFSNDVDAPERPVAAPSPIEQPSDVTAVQDYTPPLAPSAAEPPSLGGQPEYGLNVFANGHSDPAATMGRVRDLRFGWQKSLIRWRDVEGAAKRRFDWAATDALVAASDAAGLKMLARVDFQPAWSRRDGANNGPPDNYQDYADFLYALASRYGSGSERGRIHAIEVWNEVNLGYEWGGGPINRAQAADYVRLLTLAHAEIKRADPSIIVVSAGLAPTGTSNDSARPDDVYLRWMYEAGLRGHFDVLGAHAPGFKAPPEVSPQEASADPNWGGHRAFTFRRVEDLRAIMREYGDAERRIWITEFGWTSDTVNAAYAWFAVSEQTKAEYLVRALRWAREHWSDWIGVMFVWNLPDPHWNQQDEKYWWGITDPDGVPRPAYTALHAARRDGTLP